MKPGQVVTYVDHAGTRQRASVVAVVGAGDSGYKTLDLYVSGEVIASVDHEHDRVDDAGWWTLAELVAAEPEPVNDPDLELPVWQDDFATEAPDV